MPEHHPPVTITQTWNAGKPRWGWCCSGCGATGVGIRTQFDSNRAATAHECQPTPTNREDPA